MANTRRREIISWSLYDFGSSAFNTLMVTFIFNFFFVKVMASDVDTGTVIWTRALNISAVIVALISPVLGAAADYSGRKKHFLVFFGAISVLFTSILFFVDPKSVLPAIIIFIVANTAFEAANVFYYSFLPDVSKDEDIGRVSGYGFGAGYFGGLLCLVAGLALTKTLPEAPNYWNVRSTYLLVAAWFLVFALPTVLFVKQKTPRREVHGGYVKHAFERLYDTAQHARKFKEAGKLVIARMVYNDGLVTIIGMASIYASAVLGMPLDEVLVMAIVLNVFAGIGALSLGYLDDRIGGKKTILISLVGLITAAAIGVGSGTVQGFWTAAILIGLMMGPNQSASRSLLSKLVPVEKQAEFFGLYSFSGKISSMFGPLAYGTIVASTGNHKLAMSSIIVFFVVGGLLLLTVREAEGMRLAGRGGALEPALPPR